MNRKYTDRCSIPCMNADSSVTTESRFSLGCTPPPPFLCAGYWAVSLLRSKRRCHSPPSCTRGKCTWSCNSTALICLHGVKDMMISQQWPCRICVLVRDSLQYFAVTYCSGGAEYVFWYMTSYNTSQLHTAVSVQNMCSGTRRLTVLRSYILQWRCRICFLVHDAV
jgi:hypothetical protein